MKQKHLRKCLAIVAIISTIILVSQVCIIRWNLSNSLPGRMFIGTTWKFTPRRGDMISFDHPIFPAPIAKIVVGVAGDRVEILRQHVVVNGIERVR